MPFNHSPSPALPPATAFCRCLQCNAKRFELLKRLQWVRIDKYEDGSAVLHWRYQKGAVSLTTTPIAAASVEEAVDSLRALLHGIE